MRYLKTYKLFESIDNNIKLNIEDILLELEEDKGFQVDIKDMNYYKDGNDTGDCLSIYIKDNQDRFFRLEDIMDVLLRIKEYLKESDYSIDIGNFVIHTSGMYLPNSFCSVDDYLDIDNFMEEFSGEELYNINIFIYNNPRISPFKRKYTVDKDIFETKKEVSNLKFTLQPKKKGAKTDTYNVNKDGNVIGQIKWYSRMRGYGFLPTPDCNDEIKEFIKDLMKKRREEK
jgi:hypothetical protein